MPVNIQLSKIDLKRRIQKSGVRIQNPALVTFEFLVGPGGIEPPTSPLSGVRSSHLSYGPIWWPAFAGAWQARGPPYPSWWSWSGSNRRPPECKSGALPAELQPLNSEARSQKPEFRMAGLPQDSDF